MFGLPPDSYLFSQMGYHGWVSHYGSDFQFNVLPMEVSEADARLFHGGLNPNHVSKTNPLFAFPQQNTQASPEMINRGLAIAETQLRTRFQQIYTQNSYAEINQFLSSMLFKLNSIIGSKNIPDDKKELLKEKLEVLNELSEDLAEVKKDIIKPGADTETLLNRISAIKTDAIELNKEIAELISEIKSSVTNPAAEDPAGNETAGPNGTTIKDGKYYDKNGVEVEEGYAKGTEVDLDDKGSARIWENGENVTFKDKDGKEITHDEFMKNNPDEYVKVIQQQIDMVVDDAELEVTKNNEGELETAKIKHAGKEFNLELPIDINDVKEALNVAE